MYIKYTYNMPYFVSYKSFIFLMKYLELID